MARPFDFLIGVKEVIDDSDDIAVLPRSFTQDTKFSPHKARPESQKLTLAPARNYVRIASRTCVAKWIALGIVLTLLFGRQATCVKHLQELSIPVLALQKISTYDWQTA